MPSPSGPFARRALSLLIVAVAAAVMLPAAADAAQPASLRLLGSEPEYRAVQLTTPGGRTVTAAPGLFRLRVTPAGGAAAERRGFCADAHHAIDEGIDYSVSLRTEADEPLLASPRYGEAAWLVQQAQALVDAAPASARALDAGALQVAVWQLTDQIRDSAPTDDPALNARVVAFRALAAGRAVGGPVAISNGGARGCAGRGAVALRLTGRPGSTAALSVAAGVGAVSPAQVRFDAAGVAVASVTSPTPGIVTVVARSDGGTLTRAARASARASTPQETIFLVPGVHTASASVTFDDCPVTPLDTTPALPLGGALPGASEGPVAPLGKPSVPTGSTPGKATPRRPSQSRRPFTVTKTGPARAVAGTRVTYRIRVRNRGSVALAGLAVADDMPAGMSLARVPSGSRLRGGRILWTLGPLRAGRTRTLTVRVRIDAGVTGRRCNRASVRRAGLATARARACTKIRSTRRRTQPAVTA